MSAARVARSTGAAALVLALGYLVLEAGAALLTPPFQPYNPHTLWVEQTPHLTGPKSFHIATNNYGFRNAEEFVFPMDHARPHVLLVGDSLMFGGPNDLGVDDFLRELLAGHDVFNAGSPGANVGEYREAVEDYLDRLTPDYVFVGLFPGNDFVGPDAEQRAAWRYRARQVVKGVFPHTARLVKRLRTARGAQVGEGALHPVGTAGFRAAAVAAVRDVASGLGLDADGWLPRAEAYDYGQLLSKRPDLAYVECARIVAYAIVFRAQVAETLLLSTPAAQEGYDTALRSLDAIGRDVRHRRPGARLAFVLVPVSFTVDARYAAFYRDLGYVVPPASSDYPLHARLLRDLRARSFPVLDLHETVAGRDAFFLEDWHLNEEGNRWVAGEIARWVRTHPVRATAP